jgi:hypothetical protein
LINEEQIKVQLTQALQIKEDKMNKLENKLINLDEEYIKQLVGKEKELSEIKQELKKTSASYDNNGKKQILKQVNKFLKAKDDFLTLRKETIEKLQKQNEVISNIVEVVNVKDKIFEMKKFQDILIECNEVGLFQMNKDYNSLKNIIQENKELKVSLKINDILKVDSFDFNKYKINDIFKVDSFNLNKYKIIITTNSRIYVDSDMMVEDIKLLKKNLGELKLELRQQKKELKKLVD